MTSTVKFSLVAMIAVSVVSDAMLLPFYPQFFEAVFSVTEPRQVGFYLGATCFVVMLAFPLWARIARSVPVIRLLIYTQFAAGVLSILCHGAETLRDFWLVSLLMLVFKASYLLIYPHIMRFEQQEKHSGTIGLLSVIVHLGAIVGAGTGGFVLQWFEPRQVFLLMAAGDFAQMFMCVFLLGKAEPAARAEPREQPAPATGRPASGRVYKLGLIMLLFYFSIWLVRPFFSRYWQSISAWDGEIVSGLVFAIPGVMAFLALCLKNRAIGKTGLVPAVFSGICGLLLQASQQEAVVLAGRCLYGWALFHATVRLDSLLFAISTPASYAADFSKIYFFQSLGALLAFFSIGPLVASRDLQMPLIAGASGWLLTVLLYSLLFKAGSKSAAAVMKTS